MDVRSNIRLHTFIPSVLGMSKACTAAAAAASSRSPLPTLLSVSSIPYNHACDFKVTQMAYVFFTRSRQYQSSQQSTLARQTIGSSPALRHPNNDPPISLPSKINKHRPPPNKRWRLEQNTQKKNRKNKWPEKELNLHLHNILTPKQATSTSILHYGRQTPLRQYYCCDALTIELPGLECL